MAKISRIFDAKDKDRFKRRFLLIVKFSRRACRLSLLGVVSIAILALMGLTKAKAKDGASKAEKYLELVFVEEPGAINGSGSGPRSGETVAKLLSNPKNKVTVMSDVALKDGPISLRGQTPAGFNVTITGDWKTSIKTPQKISYRVDEEPISTAIGTMLAHSWETKDDLSQKTPLVIFQSWKSDSLANVIIRIVDHPTSTH